MALRMMVLLAVAGVACFGAVASAAHSTRSAIAPVHIPALPAKNESSTGNCPIPARFRPAFVRAANDTGFQLSMLVAVAQVESQFKPNARSQADARGLLQVTPTTAAELKLNVDDPSSNVLAGARYLRLMLNRFQRTDLALAAYNAGPTLVERLGRAPSQETQTYVANVQQRWAALAGCT
jgi:soluble lytic murein transglycosylase-like protein